MSTLRPNWPPRRIEPTDTSELLSERYACPNRCDGSGGDCDLCSPLNWEGIAIFAGITLCAAGSAWAIVEFADSLSKFF